MKYTYKQTGVVVESDIPLDSANFIPISEKAVENNATVAADEPVVADEPAVAPAKKTPSTRRK